MPLFRAVLRFFAKICVFKKFYYLSTPLKKIHSALPVLIHFLQIMDTYLMIFSLEFSSLCREKIHEWKKSFQIKINFVGTLFLYNTFIYIRSSTTILTEDLDDSETVDYLTQTDHFRTHSSRHSALKFAKKTLFFLGSDRSHQFCCPPTTLAQNSNNC